MLCLSTAYHNILYLIESKGTQNRKGPKIHRRGIQLLRDLRNVLGKERASKAEKRGEKWKTISCLVIGDLVIESRTARERRAEDHGAT